MFKRSKICVLFTLFAIMLTTMFSYATSSDNASSTKFSGPIIDPYYKAWNNEFIIYIDNYTGDKSDVSVKDLAGDNGSSLIFFFSGLKNGDYTYEDLAEDVKNKTYSTELHDAKPILIHLPKAAKSFESHVKFKNDDEKGKLFSGGPYSKYSTYENGFYYKNKKLDKDGVNKVLKTYKSKAKEIDKTLSTIKSLSLKDLFEKADKAYLTNGASSVEGTPDAKIYVIDVNKKFSPYGFDIFKMYKSTSQIFKGAETKNKVPNWKTETIYIFPASGENPIELTFEAFKQTLWEHQDKSIIDWFNKL